MDQTGNDRHREPMKVRAWAFSVNRMENGRHVGQALVCPSARYACRALLGVDQLERMTAPSYRWVAIERELSETRRGPLSRDTTVWQLVAGQIDVAVAVRHAHTHDIEIESPEQAASALDAYFRTLLPGGS